MYLDIKPQRGVEINQLFYILQVCTVRYGGVHSFVRPI